VSDQEYVIKHGVRAKEVDIHYQETHDGMTIILQGNGIDIPLSKKEKIFERGSGKIPASACSLSAKSFPSRG
jgi:signal transduction histidine kinase